MKLIGILAGISTSAALVGSLGLFMPAEAGCNGSWSNYGYSGRCSDAYGGNYQVHGGSYGSTRMSGYTGNGTYVNGSINPSGTFNGHVGGRYVTCSRYGCY
jgi:hypothetical protein